jgi:hypothetical protein
MKGEIMSWPNASMLSEILESLRDHVVDRRTRESIYRDIVLIFNEHEHIDVVDECLGAGDPAFDAAYTKVFTETDKYEEGEEE